MDNAIQPASEKEYYIIAVIEFSRSGQLLHSLLNPKRLVANDELFSFTFQTKAAMIISCIKL